MDDNNGSLSFASLAWGNKMRLPLFKGEAGNKAHEKDDRSDWSLNDWIVAVTGELGEMANVAKKIRRGDMSLEQALPLMKMEISDIIIYLDILAGQCGINLGDAVIETFNNKSDKIGVGIYIGYFGATDKRNK